MITEDELDALFDKIEQTYEAAEESLLGVVVFLNLETKAHVYGIGSGKERLIESMETMVRELKGTDEPLREGGLH